MEIINLINHFISSPYASLIFHNNNDLSYFPTVANNLESWLNTHK